MKLQSQCHRESVTLCVRLMARLKRDKDILMLGGAPDSELTQALEFEPKLQAFLNQAPGENTPYPSMLSSLLKLSNPR